MGFFFSVVLVEFHIRLLWPWGLLSHRCLSFVAEIMNRDYRMLVGATDHDKMTVLLPSGISFIYFIAFTSAIFSLLIFQFPLVNAIGIAN